MKLYRKSFSEPQLYLPSKGFDFLIYFVILCSSMENCDILGIREALEMLYIFGIFMTRVIF